MSFSAIPKVLRPSTISRSLSSLRSSRGATGPRNTIGRRPPPARIPDAATKVNNELLPPASNIQGTSGPHYNSLSTPVYVPEDPGAVITSKHPAARLLENSALVIQRQLELGNILIGYEQANKYAIMDPDGNSVGFIAEEENSFTKLLMRQWARTHRSFLTHVFDKHGVEVLRFHRPFSFVNSKITAYDPIDPKSSASAPSYVTPDQYRIIGECQQQWHMWRRRYNLFLYDDKPEDRSIPNHEPVAGGRGGMRTQFAYVDEPLLSWDFSLLSADQPPRLIGSVNRNFAGFAREIFTDTGVYALRMDAASVAAEPSHLISNTHQQYEYRVPLSPGTEIQKLQGIGDVAAGRGMTLDERSVMLAAAVSIDFDYFSRHSSIGHGGIMPIGMFGGGDHSVGRSDGGVADGVGAGMMGGAMGGAMGGYMGGQHKEQFPQQEQYQPPEQQQQQQGDLYPSQPPQEQQQPHYPPQEQESQGEGSFWDFFDEED
ncbi:Scramblase-domain-containing protein [Wilcoxina mikolae CBS 423.85]|nr:Scramblase-domain-containing protein [Wilcoxina mikolae CBS 423.85]